MTAPLKAKADSLPQKPGIYFFKNGAGEVVYIGKARHLRDRVRSYFQPTDDPRSATSSPKRPTSTYILTGSEREAAFLENNFIQHYQPKFNLRLKDDKSFPYLKLNSRGRLSRIRFSRKVEADGAQIFRPVQPGRRGPEDDPSGE